MPRLQAHDLREDPHRKSPDRPRIEHPELVENHWQIGHERMSSSRIQRATKLVIAERICGGEKDTGLCLESPRLFKQPRDQGFPTHEMYDGSRGVHRAVLLNGGLASEVLKDLPKHLRVHRDLGLVGHVLSDGEAPLIEIAEQAAIQVEETVGKRQRTFGMKPFE